MAKNRKTRYQPANSADAPSQSDPSISQPVTSTPSRLKPFDLLWIILPILLAAIPFIYGKYIELGTSDPYDSSFNVYQAKALIDGQTIDRDITISARPGTLLVNIIGVSLFGYNETGPKIIQLIMQITALGLIFYAARRLLGHLPAAAVLILAAFYLSLPPYIKQGNVKEQFMIACALIAAAGWILHELGGSRRWLIVCGAAAVNTWYFKPTGVSLIIAIAAYIVFMALGRHKQFKEAGSEMLTLFYGCGLGIIPVALLFAWQGKLSSILSSLPAAPILLILALAGLYQLASKSYTSRQAILKIRWLIPALALTLLIFIGFCVYYASLGQLPHYLSDLVYYQLTIKIIAACHSVYFETLRYLTGNTAYLGTVRDFSSQFNQVTRYSQTLLTPIGFGFAAVLIALINLISYVRQRKAANFAAADNPSQSPSVQPSASSLPNQLALMLIIWWVLDMAFIWISPRSYVQYYLPLNGSAALLAGWTLFQCRKNHRNFIILAASWLALDLFLTWVIARPGAGFGLKTAETVGPFWSAFTFRLIFSAALTTAVLFLRKPAALPIRYGLALLITLILILSTNTKAATAFKQYAHTVGQPSAWQQIGDYIKKNSSREDTLYVWGWFPGIYLTAQRVCPASKAAYSDMHSDDPWIVHKQIDRLITELNHNKPLYIVDSQKAHFPYYEHPLFDLWLRWRDNKHNDLQLRVRPTDPVAGNLPMSLAQAQTLKTQTLDKVAAFTKMLLTHPQRPGGPMPEDIAQQRADMEKQRHEYMWPLREFVMKYYEPVRLNTNFMYIYRLKK